MHLISKNVDSFENHATHKSYKCPVIQSLTTDCFLHVFHIRRLNSFEAVWKLQKLFPLFVPSNICIIQININHEPESVLNQNIS